MTVQQDARDNSIAMIVNKWIGTEGDEAGLLIHDIDVAELKGMVANLKLHGRSKGWKDGVERWLVLIEETMALFNTQNGWDAERPIMHMAKYSGYQGKELIRLYKFAILQGATYAYIGNR